MSIPTIVVGAAQSGAGKTTGTMALIAGLRHRGLTVQPFKVGPDYLDPSLLSWAAGRPCRNLDAWMLPEPQLHELFARACRGADIAVVEGVMGLFDGRAGAGDEASTAHVARLLQAPVLLLLDAARAARTVGAVALGLSRADPRLRVAGAILNRIASERHLETCVEGLSAAGIPVAGHVQRAPGLELPDRYLGLISASEAEPQPGLRQALELAARGLDLDLIIRAAGAARPPRPAATLFPDRAVPTRARIAVALDRAFHFYYRDALDLLEAWGAELVPFSPLEAGSVPPDVGGVYLGGGYPELFADELVGNPAMLESLRAVHGRGAQIYAECGGAMYVSAGIEDADGKRHRMANLWPVWVSLKQRKLAVGYRLVRACEPGLFAGSELRAHEFHYSQLQAPATGDRPAWRVLGEQQRNEGYAATGVTASYIHVHLGALPGLAASFVEACKPAS
ncbi:MAG: cobyrinate a,c-diamide synthase [Candidatus Dormibacteria bacterium]